MLLVSSATDTAGLASAATNWLAVEQTAAPGLSLEPSAHGTLTEALKASAIKWIIHLPRL